MKIVIPEYIKALCERLEANAESAYVVGGSLRDILLGKEPHDYDIATSASPERTMEIFSDLKTIATGLKHGTVTVLSGGEPVEITTFRIDGEYTDSRHPDSVCFTRSVEDDLARRDFTVNAMAYNPCRELFVDLFGGQNDLHSKIIRAVGEPRLRFGEDALRIMRAFRFSAKLGFEIEADTLKAAYECREGLKSIARERIFNEFLALLLSPYPEGALRAMKELDILDCAARGYDPDGELMDRIFRGMNKAPAEDTARLGLFLCGVGEEKAREILASLKCSNRQKTGALAVRRGALTSICSPTDAARLRANTGIYAREAAAVSALLGNSPEGAVELVEKSLAPRNIGELAIGGRELMEIGIKGKEIGRTLEALLGMCIERPELNRKEELIKEAKKLIKEE